MLKVTPVLCRAGKMDNYAYLLVDEETSAAAVLDASEAEPVIAECERQGITPQFIFNTHHHFDHVEGNAEIKRRYGAKIVGSAADALRIEGMDILLEDGDIFNLGNSEARIIGADGHTIGHILWYFPKDKILFTGDTLFNLSIGGLFEGTPEQMWHSLQKIKKLPDDTVFYPGHEYTAYGLHSLHGLPGQRYAEKARRRLAQGLPVAPVSLGEEKICNPYLGAEDLTEFWNLLQ